MKTQNQIHVNFCVNIFLPLKKETDKNNFKNLTKYELSKNLLNQNQTNKCFKFFFNIFEILLDT